MYCGIVFWHFYWLVGLLFFSVISSQAYFQGGAIAFCLYLAGESGRSLALHVGSQQKIFYLNCRVNAAMKRSPCRHSVSRRLLERSDKVPPTISINFAVQTETGFFALFARTKGAEKVFILLLVNSDKPGGQAGRADVHCSSLPDRLHLPVKNALV